MNKLIGILIIATGIICTYACKKDTNPKLPDLMKVPVPAVVLADNSDDSIRNVNTFRGRFKVDLYFKNDVVPRKMDVVVALNGAYALEKVKTLRADVSTFPTSLEVTAQQLAQLFGKNATDLKAGDTFEVSVDVTLTDGTVLHAFSEIANMYGPDAGSYPGGGVSVIFAKN